jgi:hypothetical protein
VDRRRRGIGRWCCVHVDIATFRWLRQLGADASVIAGCHLRIRHVAVGGASWRVQAKWGRLRQWAPQCLCRTSRNVTAAAQPE